MAVRMCGIRALLGIQGEWGLFPGRDALVPGTRPSLCCYEPRIGCVEQEMDTP